MPWAMADRRREFGLNAALVLTGPPFCASIPDTSSIHMANPPGTSGSLVFTFGDEVVNGSILDPTGKISYTLRSKHRTLRSDITYISTAGGAVAKIKWGSGVFSSGPTVTILPAKTGLPTHRLQPRPRRRLNGTVVAEFRDRSGSLLYWRDQECYDSSDDILVATRMSENEGNFNMTKPSSLVVRPDYCAQPCLLYILASAIVMDKKYQMLVAGYSSFPPRQPQDAVQLNEDTFVTILASG